MKSQACCYIKGQWSLSSLGNRLALIFILLLFAFGLCGCAGFGKKLKAFLNGNSAASTKRPTVRPANTFNQNPAYNAKIPHRNYRRVTKKSIEDTSSLDSRAGSLWVMEGQGAYLFSQNIMRMIGDPLAVRIDGEPKQQLESKTNVIKKLLAKLEARRARALRQPANEKSTDKKGKDAKAKPQKPATEKVAEQKSTVDDSEFSVKTVPTRITERLVDGNYRVKGSQPFMIGRREYKAIVTGIVRAEDFTEEGISASKLIDPKFDIVSVRKRVR